MKEGRMNCCWLEGVLLGILVQKYVDRDLTNARKSNKNFSPPTYDSRIDRGLSGGRIQTIELYVTPYPFAIETFSFDPKPATQLHIRDITDAHTPY